MRGIQLSLQTIAFGWERPICGIGIKVRQSLLGEGESALGPLQFQRCFQVNLSVPWFTSPLSSCLSVLAAMSP